MLVLGLVYGKPTFISDSTFSSSDDPIHLTIINLCRHKVYDECEERLKEWKHTVSWPKYYIDDSATVFAKSLRNALCWICLTCRPPCPATKFDQGLVVFSLFSHEDSRKIEKNVCDMFLDCAKVCNLFFM